MSTKGGPVYNRKCRQLYYSIIMPHKWYLSLAGLSDAYMHEFMRYLFLNTIPIFTRRILLINMCLPQAHRIKQIITG